MSYGEGHTRLDAVKNEILKIGIDASNIRRGGGLTHLYELLSRNDLLFNKKYKIILWASSDILDVIEEKKWIKKVTNRSLNGNLFLRTMWQFLKLSKSAKKEGCDILLIPGGSYYGTFKPVVSMHRNQLPFEYRELFRYGFSLTSIRLMMLRIFQLQTFRRSDGVIYLTEYCKKVVEEKIVNNSSMSVVIPHGFNTNLKLEPRKQKKIEIYNNSNPYKLIYVSIIDVYKHQWNVIEAISHLRDHGYPLSLNLIGPSSSAAMRKLNKAIRKYDPNQNWVFYRGEVQYSELKNIYVESDLAIFASTCETISNILLEKMASGLPIACSKSEPLPEVLGNGGLYFDSEDPSDISRKVKTLIDSYKKREEISTASFLKSQNYSWDNCANETFKFLERVSRAYNK